MNKWQIAWSVIQLLKKILIDTDGDGRPDLFDSEPENPDVK
jgi:hypothetical protein